MYMSVKYDGQVAIVTGSGAGLGRSHALALAARGAKVVVNDLAAKDGTLSEGALSVVKEIEAAGGEAMANGANVANMEQVQAMVAQTMEKWGRIDILVNNAGILRDKSFGNMAIEDFQLVVDVHLSGSVNCTKAVWDIMRAQKYGRIAMTTSSSGLYGNFGQANYGAAKMAVVGFMNTLCIEGEKYGIKVNCLSPTARTAMTEDLIDDKRVLELMTVESVTTGLLALVAENSPNRSILGCGAGGYARAVIKETDGIYLSPEQQTPENILAQWSDIEDESQAQELKAGWMQTNKYVGKAAASLGIDLTAKS
ncbi:MAG: NAD(P)-dependent dehydrogenase (short-subunit alcohol dehydrogenase family) [Phenylobacterium sp.]|jgi:NAD(P)-dependent dehydrogenase (short-subunit alcohol dehydrogenase family)